MEQCGGIARLGPTILTQPMNARGFRMNHLASTFFSRTGIFSMFKVTLVLLSFLYGAHAGHGATPEDSASPLIDQRAALKIGTHQVSVYLVEKYYGRFADETRRQFHRSPSSDETRAWLDLFIAKQCIIAEAELLGYPSRPEVATTVAKMERHMLTQANGPFYQQLNGPEPVKSQGELKALYGQMFKATEATIVRFANHASAVELLGENFGELSPDEQTGRISLCRDREDVQVMDGTFSWPFHPFSELAEIIPAATPGHWIQHRDPLLGEYYLFVRDMKNREPGDFAKDEEGFRHFVSLAEQQAKHRRRHYESLASQAFALDGAIAGELMQICRNLTTPNNEIPESSLGRLAPAVLFRYQLGPETQTVSVEDFCRHFNAMFVRSIPRILADLRSAAEDMAVEESDYREAKARGIDGTAKFTEDRLGFAGFQALDLFEQNILIPKLAIGAAEIETYYEEHADQYRCTNRISG